MARALRRNAHLPTDGACYYDTAVGFIDNLAAGASEDMDLEPDTTTYMLIAAVHITVAQAANRTLNGRALVKSVSVSNCDVENFSEPDGVAAGGRVAPDEFQSGDGECCLGKPVCWGWFGKEALNQDLTIRFTNISNDAVDIYLSGTGRQANSLPAGAVVGKRCGGPGTSDLVPAM